MTFKIKRILAFLLNVFGILDLNLFKLEKRYEGKYIRIVNYHETELKNKENFEKQIKWYKKHFSNVSYPQFEVFLKEGKLLENKPGIMITFDDGCEGNYIHAKEILERYSMTGYFFVSSDLIGKTGYMNVEQIKELVESGHVIGCHTATHHRMMKEDIKEILDYEIKYAKKKLEQLLETYIEIFCWCGGEEEHYTKAASDMIRHAGYKYGFLTNSFPVIKGNNPYQIQRINVEDAWSISLMKFQISGIMDWKFKKKRERVNALLD